MSFLGNQPLSSSQCQNSPSPFTFCEKEGSSEISGDNESDGGDNGSGTRGDGSDIVN